MAPPRLPRPLPAAIRGFAAWQFGLMLGEPLRLRIAELERPGSGVHFDYMRQLKAQYAELVEAGRQWQEWRACADESAEVRSTQVVGDSSQPDEITPEEAAVLLRVTP